MAKRGKTKPAARGKGKGRAKAASTLDVEDQDGAAPKAGTNTETALVYVTFLALLVALVLSQIELGSSYGKGLF
ncbi:MAG: hypothetical protein DRQ55_05855 [Planctomycetota bacterium]|nr:MAG: hypothetical protein DRQ55_05855 [Planctomycetota bacterium]